MARTPCRFPFEAKLFQGTLLWAIKRPGIVPRRLPRLASDTLPNSVAAVASRCVITLPLR